jgi:cell division inhibitor SepF
MSLWKRTMDYLGLGPDDAYDDYDLDDDYEPAPRSRRPSEPEPRPSRGRDDTAGTSGEGVVRTLPSRPTFPSRDFDPSQARRAAADRAERDRAERDRAERDRAERDEANVQVRGNRPPSRPPAPSEPATVRPRRFDQAQEVADKFKEGQPVIMNLEGADREVARRLIDFASGLCYGLDGSMEKVANGVYLLKPVAARAGRYDEYDD